MARVPHRGRSRCARSAAWTSTSRAASSSRSWAPRAPASRRFMNVLGCLDRPTRGIYRLAGRDVVAASRRDERAEMRNREIGFVFQSFNLLPAHQRARERRAAAGLRRRAGSRSSARARTQALRAVGLDGPRAAPAEPALGRPAAARRDRARARQRSPRCCSPTSRPATSTRSTSVEIMALFAAPEPRAGHHRRAGDARGRRRRATPRRVVTFRDGRIVSRRVPGAAARRPRRAAA